MNSVLNQRGDAIEMAVSWQPYNHRMSVLFFGRDMGDIRSAADRIKKVPGIAALDWVKT